MLRATSPSHSDNRLRALDIETTFYESSRQSYRLQVLETTGYEIETTGYEPFGVWRFLPHGGWRSTRGSAGFWPATPSQAQFGFKASQKFSNQIGPGHLMKTKERKSLPGAHSKLSQI